MGLKAGGMAGKYLSIAMALMLIILCGASLISKDADLSRLFTSNWSYAIPIFNVAAFSYIGQYLVPDLARGLSHDPKKLAPAMLVGQIITAALLILVPLGCFAMSPADEITEVATIAWGQALGQWALYLANIFALIAMFTSFCPISQTLISSVVDFFHFSSDSDNRIRLPIMILIYGIPLILVFGGLVGFVDASTSPAPSVPPLWPSSPSLWSTVPGSTEISSRCGTVADGQQADGSHYHYSVRWDHCLCNSGRIWSPSRRLVIQKLLFPCSSLSARRAGAGGSSNFGRSACFCTRSALILGSKNTCQGFTHMFSSSRCILRAGWNIQASIAVCGRRQGCREDGERLDLR